jgi:hypothetical protein
VSKENYAMSVQDLTAGGMCASSEDAGYDGTAYWLRVTSGLQRGNCIHSRREAFCTTGERPETHLLQERDNLSSPR